MDAFEIVSYILLAILLFLYLGLLVYLAFVMYGMSRIALFFLVLIGGFLFPVIVPAIMLILLASGAINEEVRTVIVESASSNFM